MSVYRLRGTKCRFEVTAPPGLGTGCYHGMWLDGPHRGEAGKYSPDYFEHRFEPCPETNPQPLNIEVRTERD